MSFPSKPQNPALQTLGMMLICSPVMMPVYAALKALGFNGYVARLTSDNETGNLASLIVTVTGIVISACFYLVWYKLAFSKRQG